MNEEWVSLKRLAVDKNGGIFLYDWGENTIFRVNVKSGDLDPVHREILASRDITTPGFEYSLREDAFVFGTLEKYITVDRTSGERGILAVNNHGADNFTVHENIDGSLVFIHSGQVFRLIPD